LATFFANALGTAPDTTRVTVVYSALIAIGFFIYGPVALIGVQAINLVPKNAAGTAAGFVGLFGYLIGDALLSKVLIGAVADNVSLGWSATFWIFIVASILAALFSATTWKKEKETYLGNTK
jgi:OPA family glycerol-3-phosphate transporter-like MFS transporter